MLRTAVLLTAALALFATTTAEACSCSPYQTQAEADRAGEKAYRDADLVVDATVGDVSAQYKALCPAPGAKPRATEIGRSMTADRPITIHRVLKGKQPRTPVLAGAETTIFAEGCGVMMNSCDVGIGSSVRTVLVLHRIKDGRFRAMSVCGLMALRQSKRGQTLFGAK